jgi:hypothetical protein
MKICIFFKVKTTYKIQVLIMKHWLKNYLFKKDVLADVADLNYACMNINYESTAEFTTQPADAKLPLIKVDFLSFSWLWFY